MIAITRPAVQPTPHTPYVVRGDDGPTPDQLAVLRLLAAGRSLKGDGDQELGAAARTLSRRMSRLYTRLGLTREQTLLLAGQRGWVRVEVRP